MHKTKAGEKRKTLHRKALELARDARVLQMAGKTLREARQEAQRLAGRRADTAIDRLEGHRMVESQRGIL